jgi:hypothetical protein
MIVVLGTVDVGVELLGDVVDTANDSKSITKIFSKEEVERRSSHHYRNNISLNKPHHPLSFTTRAPSP